MNREGYADPTAEKAISRVMRMYRSCSKCGKIHDTKYKCNIGRIYTGGQERQLRSQYAWTKKSEQIREKANHLCEVCRDKGIYVYDNLEVHHIKKIKDSPSLLLDDFNLICLCKEHHTQADDNKIDIEYLKMLAERRELGTGRREKDPPWGQRQKL